MSQPPVNLTADGPAARHQTICPTAGRRMDAGNPYCYSNYDTINQQNWKDKKRISTAGNSLPVSDHSS